MNNLQEPHNFRYPFRSQFRSGLNHTLRDYLGRLRTDGARGARAYSPLTNAVYMLLRNSYARMLATTEGNLRGYALGAHHQLAAGTDQLGAVHAIRRAGRTLWDPVIDGKVDGTIELQQHVLTVGPTGRVKAELSAKAVVVLGKVSGSIRASERVRIGETGSVEGAISAPRLVMVDGAHLQGRVDM